MVFRHPPRMGKLILFIGAILSFISAGGLKRPAFPAPDGGVNPIEASRWSEGR